MVGDFVGNVINCCVQILDDVVFLVCVLFDKESLFAKSTNVVVKVEDNFGC